MNFFKIFTAGRFRLGRKNSRYFFKRDCKGKNIFWNNKKIFTFFRVLLFTYIIYIFV